MKNFIVKFLILYFLPVSLVLGQEYSIKGKVVDPQNQPVPYANVVLFSSDGKKQITGTATDFEGNFELKAGQGDYIIKVTFLSYKNHQTEIIRLNKNIHLNNIVLVPDEVVLESFEVTAEKSTIELKMDKRVFNVGKDLVNVGGDATQVLERVPGVTVDMDGNLNLRGSQNVRVLIDGRPSAITGINLSDALKQIPAGMIEKVEVITNPSSKYDAEGEVGIINIILKKEKRQGMNFSLDASTGYPANHTLTINMSKRLKKLNLFANIGGQYRTFYGRGYTLQDFRRDSVLFFEKIRNHMRHREGFNGRVGFDYDFSRNTSLTISGYYNKRWGKNEIRYIYNDFDSVMNPVQSVFRNQMSDAEEENKEISFFFKKTWDNNAEWSIDGKLMDNLEISHDDISQYSTRLSPVILQKFDKTEKENSGYIQTDWSKELDNKVKLESGLKYALRQYDQDFILTEWQTSEWVQLPSFTNRVKFSEAIYAAYAIYNKKWEKFGMQAGMRFERTDLNTEYVNWNSAYKRLYDNLFPSLHFSYALDSIRTIQWSYSRRISRPRMFDLAPILNYSDNRSIFTGNPLLNPEFTDAIEATYLQTLPKGNWLLSAYYRYRTDLIQRVTEIDTNGFTRVYPINLGIQHAYGFETNFNYDFSKKLNVNAGGNFYQAITRGYFQDQLLTANAITFNGRVNIRYRLLNKLVWQFSGFYNAPQNTPQGKQKSMYSFDSGLNWEILKRKGNLTFMVRDILNSMRYRFITEAEGFRSEGYFQWRTRMFVLNFNYRIFNEKSSERRKNVRGGNNENLDMEMGY